MVKLLLFVGIPLLLVSTLITAISLTLSVDDLKQCPNGPDANNPSCQPADAIVAISGGDTDARTREAIRLYKASWAPELVLSGAAEDKTSISNAAAMRGQAIRAGVPDDAITLDEHASDTAGNAAGLRSLMNQSKLQRVIVVTSPYHQRRASIEFKRALGPTVTVVSHPTSEDKYWPSLWWLNPYSWYLAVSEIGKLIYLKVSGT